MKIELGFFGKRHGRKLACGGRPSTSGCFGVCRSGLLTTARVLCLLLSTWLTACHQCDQKPPAFATENNKQMAGLEVSDNCLMPESGLYAPGMWRLRDEVSRDALFPEHVEGVLLHAVERPAFDHVRMVMLRETAGQPVIEVYVLLEDPWTQAEPRLSQSDAVQAGIARKDAAVAAAELTVKKTSRVRSIDPATKTMIVELWRTALARTQYSESRADVVSGRNDGEIYHFWSSGGEGTAEMAGMTHSPRSGSFLDDLTRVAAGMASYAREEIDHEALTSLVAAVLRRARKHEPCLRRVTVEP